MKFPVGSVWHFDHRWSFDLKITDTKDAEVFVVIGDVDPENGEPATCIIVVDDPRFPHRDGHIMSFIPPGNLWELSRRIA